MGDLKSWVEMHLSTPMASKNPHLRWIEALLCRMEVLLNSAYQEYFYLGTQDPNSAFLPIFSC